MGQFRAWAESGSDPTIEFINDDRKRTHQTPNHEQVKEIKFLHPNRKIPKLPCPILVPRDEPKLGDMMTGPGPQPWPRYNPDPVPAPRQDSP